MVVIKNVAKKENVLTKKNDINIFKRLNPEYWKKVLYADYLDGVFHDFTKNTNKEKE
jgi:hypothetical protein